MLHRFLLCALRPIEEARAIVDYLFSVAAAGWIILLASKSKWVEFFGTMVIGSGTLPQVVITQACMNNNICGGIRKGKTLRSLRNRCTLLCLVALKKAINRFRATALAMIIMIGQSMGIASAKVYSDAPRCYRGNGFALGAMVVGIIVTAVFMIFLSKKNAMKVANQGSEEAIARRVLTIEEIQDDHPDFFYYI